MIIFTDYIRPDTSRLPKSPLLPTKSKPVKQKKKKSKTKSPPPSPDLSFSIADVFGIFFIINSLLPLFDMLTLLFNNICDTKISLSMKMTY